MVARILTVMAPGNHRDSMVKTLTEIGHTTFTSDSLPEGMDVLRTLSVDMIICDVHLQNGGSVFDFLRWVKGDPLMRAVPFVCFSNEPPEIPKYLSEGVRTAARALDAAKYITMETYDGAKFREEIEWLLPESHAGSYYSDSANHDPKDSVEKLKVVPFAAKS